MIHDQDLKIKLRYFKEYQILHIICERRKSDSFAARYCNSSCPLRSGLRRLLKWIEEKTGDVPPGVEKLITNFIRYADVYEAMKDDLAIQLLEDEIEEKDTALETQSNEAHESVRTNELLVSEIRELNDNLVARNAYCDYFNRRIQPIFGFSKKNFKDNTSLGPKKKREKMKKERLGKLNCILCLMLKKLKILFFCQNKRAISFQKHTCRVFNHLTKKAFGEFSASESGRTCWAKPGLFYTTQTLFQKRTFLLISNSNV
uniref:Uncharacterized protein n=1 Tax=Tetranychus urticae TaxID=32264 RepID=T1KE10_TETUR